MTAVAEKSRQSCVRSECPICGEGGKLILRTPRPDLAQDFSLHRCGTCRYTYTHPRPSDDLLKEIYSGEYWQDEGSRKRWIARWVWELNTFRLCLGVRPLLQRVPVSARILEVGCGSGQLALALKERGYDIEVTEYGKEALDRVRETCGIKGYLGDLPSLDPDPNYDALIFNHVLEHMQDPVQNLRKAAEILKPGGLVYIEVPNIESLQFKLFRQSWVALAIPQHISHFSPGSLHHMASRESLEGIWSSTFSPRVGCADYVMSIFPFLRFDRLRRSWSKPLLLLYLTLQALFLPIVLVESLLGKGNVVRVVYRKRVTSEDGPDTSGLRVTKGDSCAT